jgi:hypothetical protein
MSMDGSARQPTYEEMLQYQALIPPEKRCDGCKGFGWLDIGCAIDHRLYSPCPNCFRTGLKAGSISETKKKAENSPR